MNFRAVDERGRVAGIGRDLTRAAGRARPTGPAPALHARSPRRRAGPAPRRPGSPSPSNAPSSNIEQDGLTAWTFDDLPDVLDTRVAGGVVRGYPAIVDQGKSVSVRVESSADAAAAATREGVLRLVLLAVPSPSSYVQQHLTSPEKLALAASPLPLGRRAHRGLPCRGGPARDRRRDRRIGRRPDRRRIRARARRRVGGRSSTSCSPASRSSPASSRYSRDVERGIKSQNSLALLGPLNDISTQLSGLLHPGLRLGGRASTGSRTSPATSTACSTG